MKIDEQCKGTKILIDYYRDRRKLLNNMISVAEKHGFNEIILPSIEPTGIYIDKAGTEVLGQMYTFKDKGDRDICLRPEATATVQKIANKHWKSQKDVKLWYFEKCWRYERPQLGRYREFFQFGLEWINPSADVKNTLISIAKELVDLRTQEYNVSESVKRGLSYYTEDGFEISVDKLGTQKQVCGGGAYKEGIGFAIGFDRLMLC